ncbi:aminoacyl-tRNA hydrolase [Bacteroidales bacterium AH-315-I05]|nr:aminoacyl-tRNA hydrolase [Bacteroidales bacterium AH-315-I05]
MKYLIVGLGNPGKEYENTRHNIGFKVLDALAEESGTSFLDKRHAFIASSKFKGRTLVLLKPTTFMNLSGKAINYWLQKEKISLDKLLVITDDIALPFGTLRMRAKGSDGGHNGLSHIIETLGTGEFPRLRFGVGSDFHQGQQVDYVLSEWVEEEKKTLPERILKAIEMVKSLATIGINRTMSTLNNKGTLK